MLLIADSPCGKPLMGGAIRDFGHYQALSNKSASAMLRGRQDGRWQGANLHKDTRICLLIEEGGEVGS
jgi:hypothetical protein